VSKLSSWIKATFGLPEIELNKLTGLDAKAFDNLLARVDIDVVAELYEACARRLRKG
jgi:hypothetical protein